MPISQGICVPVSKRNRSMAVIQSGDSGN